MDILVCPTDKGALDLDVHKEAGDDVVTGILICTVCGETYEIDDGVPNLLPPELRG